MSETATVSEAQRIDEPKYARTSRATEGLILKLSEAGKTQTEIAAIVGVNQSTVSRTLSELTDARYLAKAILHRGATKLAERIVKDANVAESIEVLERIEVIKPKQQADSGGGRVQILIGMPGQPAGPLPVIVQSDGLSLVPRNDLACANPAQSD